MFRRLLLIAALIGLAATAQAQTAQKIRIGFFPGPYADQFKRAIQPILARQGYEIVATEFSNAIQPNSALMDGSLDLNIYQNRGFMELYNSQNKADLAELLLIPSAPLGLYSKKLHSVAEIKDGMSISLPNDPTNEGRALAFLQSLDLIKLDPKIGFGKATERNVAENPKHLKLVPLDAPQIPRSMEDVDVAAALGNHVLAAGMLLSSAIAIEDPAPQYQIIVTARAGNISSPWAKAVADAYRSDSFRQFVTTDPKAKGFSKPDYWK